MFKAPASLVLLNVGQAIKELILQHLPDSLNVLPTDDAELADFELCETNDRLELIEMQSRRLIRYTLGSNLPGILALFDTVKKVLTWQRFLKLSNFSMAAQFSSALVRFSLIDSSGNPIEWPAEGASLTYPKNGDGQVAYFPVCYIQNNTSRTLFFYLFYLSRRYDIVFLEFKEISHSENWVTLWGEYDGLGLLLPNGIDSAHEAFKVIISADEIQHWQIAQEGFEIGTESTSNHRDLEMSRRIALSEWTTRIFQVTLVRD